MRFLIDKIKLKLLLEQRRDYIKNCVEGVDILVADIIFAISLFCSEFKSVLGVSSIVIETLAWSCWFFFSFKIIDTHEDDFIISRLSNMLKVDKDRIQLRYISERLQPKFSKRDNVNKVYHHKLYQGTIFDFPELLRSDEFVIDDVRYKWWSIEALEADESIMETNSDVIAYVKDKIS